MIKTIEECLNLPELELPILSSKDKIGSVFIVYKVGFYYSNAIGCENTGIEPPIILESSRPLPKIVIKLKKKSFADFL